MDHRDVTVSLHDLSPHAAAEILTYLLNRDVRDVASCVTELTQDDKQPRVETVVTERQFMELDIMSTCDTLTGLPERMFESQWMRLVADAVGDALTESQQEELLALLTLVHDRYEKEIAELAEAVGRTPTAEPDPSLEPKTTVRAHAPETPDVDHEEAERLKEEKRSVGKARRKPDLSEDVLSRLLGAVKPFTKMVLIDIIPRDQIPTARTVIENDDRFEYISNGPGKAAEVKRVRE